MDFFRDGCECEQNDRGYGYQGQSPSVSYPTSYPAYQSQGMLPMYNPQMYHQQGWMPQFSYPQTMVPSVPQEGLENTDDLRGLAFPGYPLKKGDQGEAVKAIQRKLGVYPDGVFGSETEHAVRRFRSRNRMMSRAIVDLKTWEKMFGPAIVPKVVSVMNDTSHETIVFWTSDRCRNQIYGVPNVCQYRLVLPEKAQEYEFDSQSRHRRVGILRKGVYRSLPLPVGEEGPYQFNVTSLKENGQILRKRRPQKSFLEKMSSFIGG